ncbi:glycosyltransferase family 2 protein [Gellertiella hungarica]|uniref:glycosyltransferase family 2 protein n=1 Tax=Gellertiella hungarica TaxID=1572859 RepID=UPI00161DC116|nr:glycosyltransferase family 2 protein [Gellertiella hungarica]
MPERHGEESDPRIELLASLSLSVDAIIAAYRFARERGTSLEAELIGEGMVEEVALYRAIALRLDLPFMEEIDPALVEPHPALHGLFVRPTALRLKRSARSSTVASAPLLESLPSLIGAMGRSPRLRERIVITTPSAIRRCVWQVGVRRHARRAVAGLFDLAPQFSARMTLMPWQAFLLGLAVAALFITALFFPMMLLHTLHAALGIIYVLAIGLRLRALLWRRKRPEPAPPPEPAGPLPVYTVLVALYREAEVVDQLLDALLALDWPASRLDIKLVCEEDDRSTLGALAVRTLPPHVEVVRVPATGPRTKPKALTYALAGSRGDYVTIYDAEDRPHPLQLREAHARFAAGDEWLACLQAPLVVDNSHASWLSDLFSIEYFAQFHCFLPMLAARGRPLPLGGTSNHFRRNALLAVGAWDPYNVTEDADLGLRLARRGYRTGLIERPTWEDAPETVPVWLHQRSRWLKGWLQTFLVAMRNPRRLLGEIGPASMAVSLLTCAGMVLSALLYPFFFVSLGILSWRFASGSLPGIASAEAMFYLIDGMAMAGGLAYTLAAARLRRQTTGERLAPYRALLIPVLWLLLTLAAWKAIGDLIRNPHGWNKTPHQPSRRKTGLTTEWGEKWSG